MKNPKQVILFVPNKKLLNHYYSVYIHGFFFNVIYLTEDLFTNILI